MIQSFSRCFIGLGSNLGEPQNQVKSAIDRLDSREDCRVYRRSSYYVSKPVGFADQPDYINAVCVLETTLDTQQLLAALLNIEQMMGRIRTDLPNRPRKIDLDLLLYGTQRVDTPDLIIPHPRMHERRFVLEPLVELAPDTFIPGKGRATDYLEKCLNQEVVKIDHSD